MINCIYLIEVIDFDVMENGVNDALSSEFLGYVDSIEEAEIKIEILKSESKFYRSWECINNTYPKYTIKKVHKMIVENK